MAVSPPVPRYGTADVSLVLCDAFAAVRGLPRRLPELVLPPEVRAVVVLVVDGLGRRLLDDHADLAPTLSAAPGTTLDASFPTATTTSLTSIGTGLTPGRHGLTGTSMAVDHDDRPLVTLTWSWVRQDLGLDARDDVVPESFQSAPTLFELARSDTVRAVTVLRPEFTESGLTRAALRGGEVVCATGLRATLAAGVNAARRTDLPTVVYAHHGALDATGHARGPGSGAWRAELATVDAAVTAVAATLPRDVALVVTADHGMVQVPPDGFVELADLPELLAGVRVLAGDPRARQLHAVPGAAADVLAAWRQHVGGRGHVVARDEAIAAGWFGPRVDDHVRSRIGDVVVIASRTDVAWVHREADLQGGRMPGHHGALTCEELHVPAVVIAG